MTDKKKVYDEEYQGDGIPLDQRIIELKRESMPVIERANSYVVKTNDEYMAAGEFLKTIKGLQRKVEETFDPLCKAAHALWKQNLATKEMHMGPLQTAESVIKQRVGSFLVEMEAKRKAEEARLADKARKEAEELAAKAAKAEAAGKTEKAEALQEQAQQAAMVRPVVAPMVQKVAGISMREQWDYEITDAAKLPRDFLIPDEKRIRKFVEFDKEKTNIPGVRVFKRNIVAAGSK